LSHCNGEHLQPIGLLGTAALTTVCNLTAKNLTTATPSRSIELRHYRAVISLASKLYSLFRENPTTFQISPITTAVSAGIVFLGIATLNPTTTESDFMISKVFIDLLSI
jgi:hypothetical protein